MTVRLRMSNKDGRRTESQPYCLIDVYDNSVVSLHRDRADCARALSVIWQIGRHSSALGFDAAQLNEITAAACAKLYPGRNFDSLLDMPQAKLVAEVQRLLKRRAS